MPADTPRDPPSAVRLLPRLPALWRACATGALIGAAASNAIRWFQGEPFAWPQAAWMMAATAAAVLSTYATMPARADASGLRGFTQLGWPKRVQWADIARVDLRPWWAMWRAPGFCITTHAGKRVWLMRESHGLGALHALARRAGGAAHPLVLALETPLHRL
jgi:hypothetical protein